MDDLADILVESLTASGTRDLGYQQMLHVLEAGHAAGLILFSVDVTTSGQVHPLPEWMFRLAGQEVQTVAPDQIVPMALTFYRRHASEPELTSAWFQVYFELR